MTEQHLHDCGYTKIDDNLYEKIDPETSMFIRLNFNPNVTIEQSEKIEEEIINILTRQDI